MCECDVKFCHRRTVVSIPNGPSELAVKEAAWGLARYAAISQVYILEKGPSYWFLFNMHVLLYIKTPLYICQNEMLGKWSGANCGARNPS